MNIKYLIRYRSSSEFIWIYLNIKEVVQNSVSACVQVRHTGRNSIQIKYINNVHLLQNCKIYCNSDLSHGDDDGDDESITSRVILRVGHFAGGTEGSLSQRITSPYLSHQPTFAPVICDIFSHFSLFWF